jgi:uncharacterized protein (DUF1501 family)
MKRREFLKRASALSLSLDGLRLSAFAASPLVAGTTGAMDRVLVIIQLNGGNDGLNTIIPLDQYSVYSTLRPNIALPAEKVLRLTALTGLHPAATGIKSLYDRGRACIVQGVSYLNPNFSHFRATDIWLTAAGYNQTFESGWAGRYLDYEFPGYPVNFPNADMQDPPAIQIGSVVSGAFQGPAQSTAIAIQDPAAFYQLVSGSNSGGEDAPPDTAAGRELAYIREVASQSVLYAARVKYAADRGKNLSTLYPASGQNTLADQLKIVARLIAGGLATRTYLVSLGGFDTHSNQVLTADTTTGTHATLLSKLSAAVAAFMDDLELAGCDHRVAAMTFSEFGRRVASNSSLGTDHGTALPMLLFGKLVRGGIVGANSNLSDLSSGNLKMQFDFRSVYASILGQWFGAADSEIITALNDRFPQLDLFQTPSMLPRRRP